MNNQADYEYPVGDTEGEAPEVLADYDLLEEGNSQHITIDDFEITGDDGGGGEINHAVYDNNNNYNNNNNNNNDDNQFNNINQNNNDEDPNEEAVGFQHPLGENARRGGNQNPEDQMKHKSVLVCYVIWFFGGLIGLHRLYLGQVELCILYGLTLASCGFQWLVDLFLIPQMVKEYNMVVDIINEYDADDIYTDTIRHALNPLERRKKKYQATRDLPYIKQVMPINEEDKLFGVGPGVDPNAD